MSPRFPECRGRPGAGPSQRVVVAVPPAESVQLAHRNQGVADRGLEEAQDLVEKSPKQAADAPVNAARPTTITIVLIIACLPSCSVTVWLRLSDESRPVVTAASSFSG
jgi:hypothetical protein